MPLTDTLRDDILASVPSLRAFAISLSGNGDRADDLVQETLLRAIANIDSFQPGSNLPAWLFTILRNLFRSDYRKRRREVEDAAAICGCAVGTIKSRVNRARSKLSALLYVDGADDFGPDNTVRAVIGGNS